jgi:anaerobic selenocysteine-containing dehydrogenase
MSEQAIAPLGECRSNVDTFRALAERMGLDDACFRQPEDEMMDAALASGHHRLEGITRQRLEQERHVRLNLPRPPGAGGPETGPAPFLPFAEGNFATPSGKAEFYSTALASQGLDPVASFTPPSESRHAQLAGKYPLELLARKADNFLNSTFTNIASVQEMETTGELEMSAADARARNIADGQAVRVFNDRGETRLIARVDGAVQRGTVSARLNAPRFSPGGRNINVLTSERLTDMGGGATFYSALVEVEPVAEPHRPSLSPAKVSSSAQRTWLRQGIAAAVKHGLARVFRLTA